LYNSPCSGFPKTEEDDPNEPTEDDPNEPTEVYRNDIDIWAPYLNKPGVTRGP